VSPPHTYGYGGTRLPGYLGKKLAPASGHCRDYNRLKEGQMPRRQGRHLSTETIEKIKELLSATDLSIAGIAERIDCSKSAVASINRKYRIRAYGKNRNRWTVSKDFRHKS
jgi:predicted phage tail protein